MKKSIKIMSIVAILLLTIAMTTSVYGISIDPRNVKADMNTNGLGNVQATGSKIVGIIQVVGSITAVVVLIVLGIKYMMGSTEEKAEYKKTMMPYLIGAVFIFAAANLAGLIYGFATGL